MFIKKHIIVFIIKKNNNNIVLLSHRYRVEKQGFYPLTTIICVYIMDVCLNHFFTFSCEVNGTVDRLLFYFLLNYYFALF